MKTIFTRDLLLPLSLLILGVTIPSSFLVFSSDYPLFGTDICYWYAAFLTLSGAMLAVKLTFNRLIEINPNINAEMIFESEADLHSEQTLLTAHARTAELMIMSAALFSLVMGTAPEDFASVLLFSSLRIGAILFLLGGIVMTITHMKMKKL